MQNHSKTLGSDFLSDSSAGLGGCLITQECKHNKETSHVSWSQGFSEHTFSWPIPQKPKSCPEIWSRRVSVCLHWEQALCLTVAVYWSWESKQQTDHLAWERMCELMHLMHSNPHCQCTQESKIYLADQHLDVILWVQRMLGLSWLGGGSFLEGLLWGERGSLCSTCELTEMTMWLFAG